MRTDAEARIRSAASTGARCFLSTPNVNFFADDRDYNGLRKGEFRPYVNTKTGLPEWRIPFQPAYDKTREYVQSATKPAPLTLDYEQFGTHGAGKARELDAARRAAIWRDATDAELMREPEELRAALIARLPALLEEFKAAMLAVGFCWPERK